MLRRFGLRSAHIAFEIARILQPSLEVGSVGLGKLDTGHPRLALLARVCNELVEGFLGVAKVAVGRALVATALLEHLLHLTDERNALIGSKV